MNTVIKNIILGTQTMEALDVYFGVEVNEQNDRIKEIIKEFINCVNTYDPEHQNLEPNILRFNVYFRNDNLGSSYVLGSDVDKNALRNEIKALVVGYQNLDDVEDIFAEEQNDEDIQANFDIETYRKYPELIDKQLEMGNITFEQADKIREQLHQVEESARSRETTKVFTKALPQFQNVDFNKELELGFIEPLLLGLVVAGIGLIYVACLYLMV